MNTVVWIDLGVKDLDRAVGFYRAVLDINIHYEQYKEFRFAVFDHQPNQIGGCLIPKTDFEPIPSSTLVYFNCDNRLNDAIEQVEAHGGKVLEKPHSIGPHGSRALVLDSEGNTIALHSSTPAL